MIKYYKLLDMLNRKSMTKEELRQKIGISSATMSKISAHKLVSLDVIDKICNVLNCQPGDIIEHIPDEKLSLSAAIDTQQEESPAAEPKVAEAQTVHQKPPEPEGEAPHIPQKKPERQFKPFTKSDEAKINLSKLLNDIKYQMDIAEVYGMDILRMLMEQARKPANEKSAIAE